MRILIALLGLAVFVNSKGGSKGGGGSRPSGGRPSYSKPSSSKPSYSAPSWSSSTRPKPTSVGVGGGKKPPKSLTNLIKGVAASEVAQSLIKAGKKKLKGTKKPKKTKAAGFTKYLTKRKKTKSGCKRYHSYHDRDCCNKRKCVSEGGTLESCDAEGCDLGDQFSPDNHKTDEQCELLEEGSADKECCEIRDACMDLVKSNYTDLAGADKTATKDKCEGCKSIYCERKYTDEQEQKCCKAKITNDKTAMADCNKKECSKRFYSKKYKDCCENREFCMTNKIAKAKNETVAADYVAKCDKCEKEITKMKNKSPKKSTGNVKKKFTKPMFAPFDASKIAKKKGLTDDEKECCQLAAECNKEDDNDAITRDTVKDCLDTIGCTPHPVCRSFECSKASAIKSVIVKRMKEAKKTGSTFMMSDDTVTETRGISACRRGKPLEDEESS